MGSEQAGGMAGGWDGAGSGTGESERTGDNALVVMVKPSGGDGSLNKGQGQGHRGGVQRGQWIELLETC